MSDQILDFSNDRYTVLKTLYDHQMQVAGGCYIPLSQQEISTIVGFNRVKINHFMQELISSGYVSQFHSQRGKYMLTEKALRVISAFESLKDDSSSRRGGKRSSAASPRTHRENISEGD